jgi:hypothetical protein
MVLDQRMSRAISLAGPTLDALGGFYLTFDLLGSKYGPLRTITRLVTYSFLCTACFWPLLALENVRHGSHGAESPGEALIFQGIRAVALGLAGWLTIDARFGLAFGLASLFALSVLLLLSLFAG